jgi:hypothetical protein
MKTKNNNSKSKTIHQNVEQAMRHRVSVALVVLLMLVGVSTLDGRVRSLLQEAYSQGWGWIGMYMTHEHPAHTHAALNTVRAHTVSGTN